jgi:hypothetical protein
MYQSDVSGLGQARKSVHRRRPASGMAGLGAFGVPVLDPQCPNPPGCARSMPSQSGSERWQENWMDQSGMLRGLCAARGWYSGGSVGCLSVPRHVALSVSPRLLPE